MLNARDLDNLKAKMKGLPEVFDLGAFPEIGARLAAIAIQREIGTVHDELARFVFDADSGELVPRESMYAELVSWNGLEGVRIASRLHRRILVRVRGFGDLVHPKLSRDSDGAFLALYIFPSILAALAARLGIRLAIVHSWALRSIFEQQDPLTNRYGTSLAELVNNDAKCFAKLLSERRLALLGTHDLVAHVCGLRSEPWEQLRVLAHRVRLTLENTSAETVPDLVLPYAAGLVLDDLAQPPSYDSESHRIVLERLLDAIVCLDRRAGDLHRFPPAFEQAILLARSRDPVLARRKAPKVVNDLVDQIYDAPRFTAN